MNSTSTAFGHGNIRARSFRIQPIDRSRRPNAVDVEFMDEDSDYATNVAPAEDLDRIAETGQLVRERVRTESISNYARAAILAEKMIRIGRYVTHRIEFEAFVGAMRAKPGDVIAVHHYVEGWGGISGRVVGNAPGSTSVKLDQDLTVTAGVQCRVAVETTQSGDTVTQVRDVVEGPGTYLAGTTIDISPSWDVTDEPQDQDKFFAGDEAGQGVGPAKLYRIQSIEKGSDQHVRVVALTYDDRIYDRPGVIKPTRALLKPTDRTIPPNVVGLGGRVTKFSSQFKTTERAPSIDLSWKNAEWPYPHGNYIYVAVENIDPDRFIGPIQFTEGEQQTVPNVIEGLTYRFAVSPCSSVGRNHRAPERATQFRIVVPRVGTPSPNLP